MGKYYCDYCDTYLTHDSPSVRKTHNSGRKHKENVRYYYQKWVEEQAQSLIDQTTAQGLPPGVPMPMVAPGMLVPPPLGMVRPGMVPPIAMPGIRPGMGAPPVMPPVGMMPPRLPQ